VPGILDTLRGLGSRLVAAAKGGGGGQLPPAPEPKVKPKQQSFPSYLTTTEPSDSPLAVRDRLVANLDIPTLRLGQTTRQVIRDFAAVSPDLSAAISAYLRTAITDSYTVIAYNVDGTFNRDATALAQQIASRMDILGNYDDGFSGIWSLRSCSEALGKELMLYGGMAAELVLDKTRLPRTIAPVHVPSVQFRPDDKWLKPFQKVGSDEIDLDIPTFFYCALDQDLTQPYADSPLEAAIQPVLFSQDFMNDLRRIVKRAIHPRLGVKIDHDKFKKFIPADVLTTEDGLKIYMDKMVSGLEGKINGLKPEDALIFFDMIVCEYINNGNTALNKEWDTLMSIANSKLATGAKTLPSILGHGSGSQNIASSETLLFMKNAEGTVQAKLEEIYSKAFTLAVRLFGQDVTVAFKYESIDLRPDSELEAFKTMKQSRVLELLSLGFIEDDEAALALTGRLAPAGFKTLKGTNFMQPQPTAGAGGNPHSTTGAGGPRTGKPNTPTQTKGPAKGAEIIPLGNV
jgi:hypothetical protein